tara:strand:+ start:102 stop:620 length:519 start_codon:yes stop_codon:yes gene_type:complete
MDKNNKLKKYKIDEPKYQKFFEALGETSNEKIQLFYLLSLETGLRVNEILALKYADIDENTIKLSLTSSRQRKFEIGINALVLDAIKKENLLNPTDYYIFQSNKSNNVANKPAKHLSRQAINFAFKKASEITGYSITPSKLRTIYIKKFFESINKQAGHIFDEKTLKKLASK